MRSPEPIYSDAATADYSATTARFVVIASGGITLCGASALADGLMYNAPASGDQARVEAIGTHRVEAGAGGLAKGDKVYSDATGKGITGVATAGAFYMGKCTKAAAAGEVAQLFWGPGSNAG